MLRGSLVEVVDPAKRCSLLITMSIERGDGSGRGLISYTLYVRQGSQCTIAVETSRLRKQLL